MFWPVRSPRSQLSRPHNNPRLHPTKAQPSPASIPKWAMGLLAMRCRECRVHLSPFLLPLPRDDPSVLAFKFPSSQVSLPSLYALAKTALPKSLFPSGRATPWKRFSTRPCTSCSAPGTTPQTGWTLPRSSSPCGPYPSTLPPFVRSVRVWTRCVVATAQEDSESLWCSGSSPWREEATFSRNK